ncbi:Ferredoxin-dependent bilin reductase [Dillenia turbinata]|uniref:Ferredoxin-dependent bilin reductase n=1 Tax=Dillenia turbinata TaxID=194707 RepID=A0AAN8V2S2_9MAGN
MEHCFCFSTTMTILPATKHYLPILTSRSCTSGSTRRNCNRAAFIEVSAFSYQNFIDFALNETKLHTNLSPSPLQDKYRSLKAFDGKTQLQMLSFQAPKIRLLRSLNIDAGETMQVLDFAAFPTPQYDLPIFCANFFSSSSMNIVVLDLNPLHDVISHMDYREKYYQSLMPLGSMYAELLPWGGKITSESLRFFSPIVLWTKFTSSSYHHNVLYSAFMDYYKAWLQLMQQADEDVDASRINCNCEAQHKYLIWRVEKDPGQQILKKLIGEANAKDLLKNFLFNGIDELGSKTFLDYFPEYQCADGTINDKRSIIGKSFESRPWNDSEGMSVRIQKIWPTNP